MTAASVSHARRAMTASGPDAGARVAPAADGRRTRTVDGIELTLAPDDRHPAEWIDYNDYARQLEAAWLRLSEAEPPLNPRLVGAPGLGKTTLACHVGRVTGRRVYVFQCSMDTRPEDLLITPVLASDQRIEYRASPVVTAMLVGGALLLDEGNRMPERSWASLASLMDDRRTVHSAVAGLRIAAHPDFRLCVTMNDDASVYELPGYVQSRLKPRIEIVPPPWPIQCRILLARCPDLDPDLRAAVLGELERRARDSAGDSVRDMLTLAQYAHKLRGAGLADALARATAQVLDGQGAVQARGLDADTPRL